MCLAQRSSMQFRCVKVVYAFIVSLLLSSAVHAASITLQWDPGDGQATGYIVYYGTVSGSYTQTANVGAVTTFQVDGLNAGTTLLLCRQGLQRQWYQRVLHEVCGATSGTPPPGGGGGGGTPPPGGGSGGGTGSGSGGSTAPPPGAAGTFTLRTAVRQDRFVDLTWDVPARGATAYRVEIGRQSGQTDVSALTHDAASTLDFGEREPGVYYARVRALLGSEWSDQSHEVTFVITRKTAAPPSDGACSAAPEAPIDFVATAHGALVNLSWRAGAGEAPTGYMLYVGSAPGRQDLMTVPLGASMSLSATAANGTYALRLVAANACGSSAWGADAVLTVGPPVGGGSGSSNTGEAATSQLPGAPSGLTPQVVGTTVILTWTPPATGGAATRYVLEAMTAAGPVAVDLGGESTTFTHPNTPSGQYVITVRAGNAAGLGPTSAPVTVVVP